MLSAVSIESFCVDDHQKQDNVNQPIITVKSLKRDIKIQCISKDSHEKWVQVTIENIRKTGTACLLFFFLI
jgi:hypothetical protein